MDVECAHLFTIQWTRPAAAEDCELVARFVDRTVAVDALGDGEGRAAHVGCRDEFWRWTRAETGEVRGIIPRRENLQDAQAVFSVRDKSEHAGRDHSDFDVIHIIELTARREELIQLWCGGLFH